MLFCKTEVETILHLFWGCIQVQELWETFFNECSIDSFQLTLKNIIFNMVHCNDKHVSNLIVVITKYYIYSSRCQQCNLNIITVKEELKSICTIENTMW